MRKYILIFAHILCFSVSSFAQKIRFAPQWIPQAQFAGYYVAKALGYYEDLGLDVEIIHHKATVSNLELLECGQFDIIGVNLSDAVMAYTQGLDIVNILQTSQRASLLIIANKPLVNGLKTLEGAKIARWKSGQYAVAGSILEIEGINATWIDFMAGTNLFLSGAVDATIAMSYNELISMRSTGRIIEDNQIFRFSDSKYNIVDDGVYVLRQFAQNNKDVVERFRKATIQGWLYARQNIDQTVEIVMNVLNENNLSSNKYHQKKMLIEILRMGIAPNDDKPTFELKVKDFEIINLLLSQKDKSKDSIKYEDFVF